MFQSIGHGEASKNYKLIVILCSDSCIISTSMDSDHIKFTVNDLRDSHHLHVGVNIYKNIQNFYVQVCI
jgi:hypothetical protein